MRDGRHIHLYNYEDAVAFNTSHTIHRLSFGEPFPGMRPNPLDGTSRIIDEGVRENRPESLSYDLILCFHSR